MKKIIIIWLPYAALVTIFSGLVYGAVQQNYRQSANDPQIEIAEDIAAALEGGMPLEAVMPPQVMDVSKSIAPFIIIFDDSGKAIGSSVQLDGKTPVPPSGVFEFTKQYGEDRVTWQPSSAVRIAAVVRHFGGVAPGFILAGRSLREVEKRENQLALLVLLGWVIALGVTCIISFLKIRTAQKAPIG